MEFCEAENDGELSAVCGSNEGLASGECIAPKCGVPAFDSASCLLLRIFDSTCVISWLLCVQLSMDRSFMIFTSSSSDGVAPRYHGCCFTCATVRRSEGASLDSFCSKSFACGCSMSSPVPDMMPTKWRQ